MNNLNQLAVLVDLSISVFANVREDKEMTRKTKEQNNLGENSGQWKKFKLDPKCLFPITKLVARTWHYGLTLPWERGNRLLPVAMQPKYQSVADAQIEAFDKAVNEFVPLYGGYVNDAKTAHNGSFNPRDYPGYSEVDEMVVHPELIRNEFGMRVDYAPVPESNQFVIRLAGDKIREMKEQLESRVQGQINAAMQDLANRLIAPVQHVVNTMSKPEPKIYETLLGNVQEILNLVPALNITNDQMIVDAANEVQAIIAGINTDSLKASVITRAHLGDAARNIVNKFGAMGSRKFV